MPHTTATGGSTNDRTNNTSNAVCMHASRIAGRRRRVRVVAEPAAVDPIAERRALDLQQLGGLRLVAVAHLERPQNEIRFELAQPVVEPYRCDRADRLR